MKIALYARVSTHDQQTLALQIKSMKQYARKRKWQVVTEVEETSSAISERKKREEILLKARKREIDMVLVWKLDRWGRSVTDLVGTLQELTTLGVGFVSITEALDLSTPSGKAMAGMLAVFAQFERELLKERVKAGIAHARAQGKKHGRPRTAFAKSQQVKELHQKGWNKTQIAKKLRISRASVRRILTNIDK